MEGIPQGALMPPQLRFSCTSSVNQRQPIQTGALERQQSQHESTQAAALYLLVRRLLRQLTLIVVRRSVSTTCWRCVRVVHTQACTRGLEPRCKPRHSSVCGRR